MRLQKITFTDEDKNAWYCLSDLKAKTKTNKKHKKHHRFAAFLTLKFLLD